MDNNLVEHTLSTLEQQKSSSKEFLEVHLSDDVPTGTPGYSKFEFDNSRRGDKVIIVFSQRSLLPEILKALHLFWNFEHKPYMCLPAGLLECETEEQVTNLLKQKKRNYYIMHGRFRIFPDDFSFSEESIT